MKEELVTLVKTAITIVAMAVFFAIGALFIPPIIAGKGIEEYVTEHHDTFHSETTVMATVEKLENENARSQYYLPLNCGFAAATAAACITVVILKKDE